MTRHEVDRVGRRHLGGNHQIALILATLIVHEDEHAPVARLVDDRFGPNQHIGRATLNELLEPRQRIRGWIPLGRSQLAQAVGVKTRGAG